jgi:hypothetical protein
MARFGVSSTTKKGNGNTAVAERPERPAAASSPSVPITHDAIARKAFEIWVKKGRPQGQDRQNWNEAEAQLREAQRWH